MISAGIGISYSIVAERKREITLLKAMEYTIGQLAYYMYQWKMPVEEALKKLSGEGNQVSKLLEAVYDKLGTREVTVFGEVWRESSVLWLSKERLPEDIKSLWTDLFLHMPMEPKGLNDKLLLKKEELTIKRETLEQKYKGEQRLVMSMGLFVSLFFCLII